MLEFLQIMNNGKFDYDTTIKHVQLMPEEIRDAYIKAINACHHLGELYGYIEENFLFFLSNRRQYIGYMRSGLHHTAMFREGKF